MTNFKIQVISDTVCPWCYVGYRRLTRAITAHQTAHPSDSFSVSWHAFYLNPNSPIYPGINKREHYAAKFGEERAGAIFARLDAAGEPEGIAFKWGGNSGNTRESHRLIWYAGQKEKKKEKDSGVPDAVASSSAKGAVGGLQTRVVENLFRAYFEEEKNITDKQVLVEAGVGAGLEKSEVEELLESDKGGLEVDLEAERARRRFVTGVPYFTIQGRFAVEGADEPETFLEVFDRVKKEENEKVV